MSRERTVNIFGLDENFFRLSRDDFFFGESSDWSI